MDDQRTGRIVRALRQRRGWRQADLAAAAGCSQNLISLVERGHFDRIALRTVRRILAALDAAVFVELRWRGAALDRLLDEGHASLAGAVAEWLRGKGWQVEFEVTYSEFGERGSFDLLAYHPVLSILLVIEVKTDLPSGEATLRKLDEKARLAAKVARDRFDWRARSVSRVVVMPESKTLRRRVSRHSALFQAALPARNVEIRRWLARPSGQLAGLWFFSGRDSGVPISTIRRRERVRRPNSVPINPLVAA
ncbi:MAG: helix-turn-helix domain-containing protein [Candidatus Limnocylindrales bacterium]